MLFKDACSQVKSNKAIGLRLESWPDSKYASLDDTGEFIINYDKQVLPFHANTEELFDPNWEVIKKGEI